MYGDRKSAYTVVVERTESKEPLGKPGRRLEVCLFIQLHTAALRLIVRSGLDVPTFATRRLHAFHHARAHSGGR